MAQDSTIQYHRDPRVTASSSFRFWRSNAIFWRIFRISFMAFLGMAAFTMLFEEKFIFFPSRYPSGRWDLPKTVYLHGGHAGAINDCWFTASDGVRLHGWLCSQERVVGNSIEQTKDSSIILWCHGNAGNITDRYEQLVEMIRLPADIFLFDYRGYGKSEGKPSEAGLYLDTMAAWNYLVGSCGYRSSQIVIYGNSLGGAVAIDLASRVQAAGLIIQSSFTSIRDMAAATMPFIPRFLIRTKMNSVDKIPRVSCPKLFIHSPVDEIVPYELGRRLFERAEEPKEFYEVPNAGHNETYIAAGDKYFSRFKEFFERHQQQHGNIRLPTEH